MAEVHILDLVTRLDVPANRVLEKALGSDLKDVVVAGYTVDGDEYFASSVADGGDALWLLERCKKALLSTPEDQGDGGSAG